MIAWAHCSCCITSSTRHGSHSLQRLWMAFSISIADVHLAVGVWLHELLLILGEAGCLTPTAHREPPAEDQPRRVSVLALLAFLIDQTARSQASTQRRGRAFPCCAARCHRSLATSLRCRLVRTCAVIWKPWSSVPLRGQKLVRCAACAAH